MGASLLVFANKTDVGGCMNDDEIGKVRILCSTRSQKEYVQLTLFPGTAAGCSQDAQVDHPPMQCHHGRFLAGRIGMGGAGCERETVLVLRFES